MTRDMTEREFKAALERNGFRLWNDLWVEHKDHPTTKHGLLHKNGKVARRASVRYLIKQVKK